MGDNLLYGLVVFVCVAIVGFVLVRRKRETVENTADDNKGIKDINPLQSQIPIVQEEEEDYEELIAVISAAVAAALGRPASSLIVRSIRNLEPHAPSWTIAGRQDQIGSRF